MGDSTLDPLASLGVSSSSPAAPVLAVIQDRPSGTCPWCAKPLGETGKFYNACHDHQLCQSCNEIMHPTEIRYCIDNSLPPIHSRCLALDDSIPHIKDNLITVTQATLDRLNIARLLIEPNLDWSPETNSRDAEYKAHSYIHGMETEKIYLILRRMEAMTAELSIALKRDRKAIESKYAQRSADQFKQAEKERKANSDKAPNAHAKVERKKLTSREKAINALMAIGLSEADATISVDGAKQ